MCLICISVVVSLITILTNCWFSLSKRPFMTMVQVKTLFSVLFYSEVSDFDWAIKVFLCISSMHMVGCKHQFVQTRHGLLSPQDPSLGSHTITDLFFFYCVCSWKQVDPTKLYFSKSSGVSMPFLYLLKPGICQRFSTMACWKHRKQILHHPVSHLQQPTPTSVFFGGGSDISRNLRLENPN